MVRFFQFATSVCTYLMLLSDSVCLASCFLESKLVAWNLKKRDCRRQTLKKDEGMEHEDNADRGASCVLLV
jgi:hypothetical protein